MSGYLENDNIRFYLKFMKTLKHQAPLALRCFYI